VARKEVVAVQRPISKGRLNPVPQRQQIKRALFCQVTGMQKQREKQGSYISILKKIVIQKKRLLYSNIHFNLVHASLVQILHFSAEETAGERK
jgi:hypothetical protein